MRNNLLNFPVPGNYYVVSRQYCLVGAATLLLCSRCISPACADSAVIPYLIPDGAIGLPIPNNMSVVLPGRFALVVGINRYFPSNNIVLSDLTSAENDATEVNDSLRKAGFTTMLLTAPNTADGLVTKNNILNALASLALEAKQSKFNTKKDPIVLMYFAGHGLGDGKEDYILPANFEPYFAEDIKDMAVSVTQILERLETADPARIIVIMDSCRNQKPVSLRSMTTPTLVKQLIPGGSEGTNSDTSKVPGGADIVYATLKNQTADGDGENGRFTGPLIKVMSDVLSKIEAGGGTQPSAEARPTLTEIVEATESIMSASGPTIQLAQLSRSAPVKFNFFPTWGDFNIERLAYSNIVNAPLTFAGPKTALEVEIPEYCQMQDFVTGTSSLSYFGVLATSQMKALSAVVGAVDCRNPQLKTVAKTTKAEIKGIGDTEKIISVGDVLQSPNSGVIASQALSGFQPGIELDQIARVSTGTTLLRSPSNVATHGEALSASDFVHVLDNKDPKYVKIKTEQGQEGYLTRNTISSGKVTYTVELSFSGDSLSEDSAGRLERTLSQIVPTDAVVLYSLQEGIPGMLHGQSVAAAVVNRASGVGSRGATFVPNIVGDKSLQQHRVRLTVVGVALAKNVVGQAIPEGDTTITFDRAKELSADAPK